MSTVQPIIWQGEVVGHISDLKSDMFDFYGNWIAGSGEKTTEFLERLRAEEQLWVQVGNTTKSINSTLEEPDFTIEEEPDSKISLKLRTGIL